MSKHKPRCHAALISESAEDDWIKENFSCQNSRCSSTYDRYTGGKQHSLEQGDSCRMCNCPQVPGCTHSATRWRWFDHIQRERTMWIDTVMGYFMRNIGTQYIERNACLF